MKEFIMFMTLNACYLWNLKNNISITPTMIIIHSTAAPGVRAGEWFKRWNHSLRKVGIHAFIDDLEFWLYLPLTMWAWGVGGKANAYSLQIEMCEDEGWHEDYFRKVLGNTIKKVAEWCMKFNIPVSRVIAHYEAYLAGLGGNHGDPRHWWSKFGYTMDDFRRDVQAAISKPIEELVDKVTGKQFTTANLNVRYGPGTNFKILKTIPKGTHIEIYGISGEWAKVKYDGVTGFAYTGYMRDTIKGYVTASVLNVRRGPGVSHDIVLTMKKGDEVTLQELVDGWWRIPKGYVSADWISDKKSIHAETQTVKRVRGQVVNCTALNVRKTPSGKVLCTLSKGDVVDVVRKVGSWYELREGYVYERYIKII